MRYIQRLSMGCCNCCSKDDEPTIIDGHEYIDLGLPSGKKWASRNIGADVETDYGDYFAWGETTGYDINGTGRIGGGFTWQNYVLGDGNNPPSSFEKYNSTDNKTVLDSADDAAKINWGGDWKIPTAEDFIELQQNTNIQFVEDYEGSGVAGALFISKKNNKKQMFLPFAGNSAHIGEARCCYWTSSLNPDLSKQSNQAYHFHALESQTDWNYSTDRFYGFTIRPIQD